MNQNDRGLRNPWLVGGVTTVLGSVLAAALVTLVISRIPLQYTARSTIFIGDVDVRPAPKGAEQSQVAWMMVRVALIGPQPQADCRVWVYGAMQDPAHLDSELFGLEPGRGVVVTLKLGILWIYPASSLAASVACGPSQATNPEPAGDPVSVNCVDGSSTRPLDSSTLDPCPLDLNPNLPLKEGYALSPFS